jgi:cell division septum initiation protein DivIVA
MSRDANAQLKKQISEQQETINKFGGRVSSLVDRIYVLESNLDNFKQEVTKDMTDMIELIRKAGNR